MLSLSPSALEGLDVILGIEPMGQSLDLLPPAERAERYRQFAAISMNKAQETTDPDRRAEYLAMASGWHSMAVEAERSIKQWMPGEIVEPDHDEAPPGGAGAKGY